MEKTTAERIMAAARQVFLERGLERASMDGIARIARVSKQTIYALHPSKADLFAAIMRDLVRAAADDSSSAPLKDLQPQQILEQYVRRYLASTFTAERQGLFRANLVAARRFPELFEELQRFRLGSFAIPVERLKALLQDGGIPSADPVEINRRIAGLAAGGSRHLLGCPLPTPVEQEAVAHASVLMVLEGYASCPNEEPAPSPNPLKHEDAPEPSPRAASLRLSQERLDALLDAAAAEFLEYGFRQAQLDRILSGLGISTATLHRHFGSKAGLFKRAVQHLGAQLWGDDCPEGPAGTSLEASLTQLARWTLDRHLQPESLALQRLLICEADQFPAEARWAYEQMLAAPISALSARLAAHGVPRPEPFAQRAFFTLVTYGLRFIVTEESLGEGQRADLAQEGVHLFLHGCSAAPPQHPGNGAE